MSIDISFKDAGFPGVEDAVAKLLRGPRLWIPSDDYPGHFIWVEQAIADIEDGRKMAIAAFMGLTPVGSITYQVHPKLPNTLEIKNLAVQPEVAGRYFASFLLRQVEVEGKNNLGVVDVIGDTKATNSGLLAFITQAGYKLNPPEILDTNYGHNGVPDVVFTKRLKGS